MNDTNRHIFAADKVYIPGTRIIAYILIAVIHVTFYTMKSVSPSSLSRLHNCGGNGNGGINSAGSSSTGSNHNFGKNTPTKRPLLPITTPNHNSSNNNHRHHTNSVRLRSPKGSSPFLKRSNTLSWLQRIYRILPRHKASSPSSFVIYTALLSLLSYAAYITLQERIISAPVVSTTTMIDTNDNDTNHFSTSVIPTGTSTTITNIGGTTVASFDSTLHHVIPKSIYVPKSSNPIPVIYIGRSNWQSHISTNDNDEHDDDILLDALQRSAYTKVMTAFLYSSNNITHPMHLLYQQQYHDMSSLDRTKPFIFVVDWSALLRDCHILQRIVHHILQPTNYGTSEQYPTTLHNNVYMLLLDASASSQPVMCHDSVVLKQLIPNSYQNIRLAKRSIITNRRYNFTKQWIESGTLISNPIITTVNDRNTPNHILHWSGYGSQPFVQLLDIAVNDFTDRSLKRGWQRRRHRHHRYSEQAHNIHNRPIDVTHYWKSVTSKSPSFAKDEHQYYYNRLRQTVQLQINTTRQVMMKHLYSLSKSSKHIEQQQSQETDTSSRWVEFVGIDTQVEFVPSHSSSDGPDNKSNSNDPEAEETDESLAHSSVHVAVLASSKIVVVTQADEYEDHDTRLFEALASGAMVLCDTMMAPPLGLVHKTNIVFFDSPSKLDQYIQYYLNPKNDIQRQEIARHGVEYALGRHRSWHVLEALLFGKALTRTDKHPLMEYGPTIRTSSTKNERPLLISLK